MPTQAQLYKIVMHYSNPISDHTLTPHFKSKSEAWAYLTNNVLYNESLTMLLTSILVEEIQPTYVIVGNRRGETWKSVVTICQSLEEAQNYYQAETTHENWLNMKIYQEVLLNE